MTESAYPFQPERYKSELEAIIAEIQGQESLDPSVLAAILRRYPKDGRGFFSKSEIIRGFRHLQAARPATETGLPEERRFVEKLRMKPVRTQSGVAPVTVLTKPYPCPGRCIFCPSDVRMPKSYLSDEPGAQRAAEHQFDPYGQTLSRLWAFHHNGHVVDKVELIVLGGTWSSYPEPYQLWFLKRCFDAMNDFGKTDPAAHGGPSSAAPRCDFRRIRERVDGRLRLRSYNEIVRRYAESQAGDSPPDPAEAEEARWQDLERVERYNETAGVRCVGLVVETRPDSISEQEVIRIRRLGATKVQIGYQSLSDSVLSKNRRGHSVAATRRAMGLLRQAGFKIHAHWMPNLYGSSPEQDVEDFKTLFDDADFRPDELKIYPCSLIESAELMSYYEAGKWRPYSHDELLRVLTECLRSTPEYCRLTRIVRDIPGTDIVCGNKLTNFRQVAEGELANRGWKCRDIRSREVGRRRVRRRDLTLRRTDYATSVGREVFLQFVTSDDCLAGFLRLALPTRPSFIGEIQGRALIREIHVYGSVVGIGAGDEDKTQHLGLGKELLGHALALARDEGFDQAAVISSVGTREYYRRLGFSDGALYQHRSCVAVDEGTRLPFSSARDRPQIVP